MVAQTVMSPQTNLPAATIPSTYNSYFSYNSPIIYNYGGVTNGVMSSNSVAGSVITNRPVVGASISVNSIAGAVMSSNNINSATMKAS